MFDDISTIVALYGNKIILMGDFNSRTGEISDILEVDKFDIDYMDDDIVNMYNTEYSLPPRCNKDKIINQQCKALIELCKSTDLINGRCGDDRDIGCYTCYKYNGKSTVDYVILSPLLLNAICNFFVDTLDKCLSDAHAPICIKLQIDNSIITSDLLAKSNASQINLLHENVKKPYSKY